MLSISWQYLLGRAVAAEVTDRSAPEWPPHPDRVFQALVSAWGERGADATERAALEYLEALGAPSIVAPDFVDSRELEPLPSGASVVWAGANPGTYVPTNDDTMIPKELKVARTKEAPKRGKTKPADPLAPEQSALIDPLNWYADVLPATRPRKARHFPSVIVGDQPCALVWPEADPGAHFDTLCRLCAEVVSLGHSSSFVRMSAAQSAPPARWVPCDDARVPELHLRVPARGRVAELVQCFSGGDSGWRRPFLAGWQAYARAEHRGAARGHHAGRMIVLRRVAGDPLVLTQSLALSRALRSTLLREAKGDARWLLSGHELRDETPLSVPHVAYVPLAFVGAPYADGHLLGLALVLPRDTSADEEGSVLDALAGALDSETDTLELELEDGRVYVFTVEERLALPAALKPPTWSLPSTRWATVTPIVLDRFPPRGCRDHDAFVEEQIRRACAQTQVPEPAEIAVLDVTRWEGVPRAKDFPPHLSKRMGARLHVHAALRFDEPVAGPLLLGAGRYRGYGLCKPWGDAPPSNDALRSTRRST